MHKKGFYLNFNKIFIGFQSSIRKLGNHSLNFLFCKRNVDLKSRTRKSPKNLVPIENPDVSEDPVLNDMDSCKDDPLDLAAIKNSLSEIFQKWTSFVSVFSRDSVRVLVKRKRKQRVSDLEKIKEKETTKGNGKDKNNYRCPFSPFRCKGEYSHKNTESKNDYPHYLCGVDNTNYNWNNLRNFFNIAYLHVTLYIPKYFLSCSKKYLSRSNNSNHSYMSNKFHKFHSYRSNKLCSYTSNEFCSDNIWGEGGNNSECGEGGNNSECGEGGNNSEGENFHRANDNHLTTEVSCKGFGEFQHLWVQCEVCYGPNYKKFFKSKLYICEYCGFYLKMSSSDRIELSIDPDTWVPMDEDMISDFEEEPSDFDFEEEPSDFEEELSESDLAFLSEFFSLFEEEPSDFDFEEEPYKDRIDSYQKKTGLTEAIQTGTGELNGIPVAIGVMDFQFIGGSMGSVVGEKITRLIEHATKNSLPLILVCASGGARMQEGSLSLMQMAKISAALYNYQKIKKLFYVSILTSPTTGGVTASFGMLGDIIISEPKAYIAFAGKRVIEETLKITVPEGSQEAEPLFEKGLLDQIVERKEIKVFLSDLFELHGLN